MRFWSFVYILLLSVGFSSRANAWCRTQGLNNTHAGDEYTINWTVTSGGTCNYNFFAKTYAMYAVEFATKPKHGVLGHAEKWSTAYRAAEGYTGPDYLVFHVIVQELGKPGMITIKVNVNIVPGKKKPIKA